MVTPEVLRKLYRDSVRLSGVNFPEDEIVSHFEKQLNIFYRYMRNVMAWILIVRRSGGKPNLNNIDMNSLFKISDACELRRSSGSRVTALSRSTGTAAHGGARRLREVTRELARIPPKRVIRGKFEAWFFIEFWRHLVVQLRSLAEEAGGKVSFRINPDYGTFIASLRAYQDTPYSLDLFLRSHLSDSNAGAVLPHPDELAPRQSWWRRLFEAIKRE